MTWYRRGQRDLPWRVAPSPYKTLVSEFMLQQTVVATVIPYFERFVARFPNLAALATASPSDVAAAWSGLGYYARARNLHRAAQAVVQCHAGELPADESALRQLPGIGPYTAAAVAAIAFGRRAFALDGNAARVVARLCGIVEPIDRHDVRQDLHARGLRWVPAAEAGDFAQSIMELGATVCRPKRPRCDACPVGKVCVAAATGRTDAIPARTARPQKRRVRWAALRIRSRGFVAMELREAGLLAGTWMLPAIPIDGDADAAQAMTTLLRVRLRSRATTARCPLPTDEALNRAPVFVGSVRHVFTHRELTVELFESLAARRSDVEPTASVWRWLHPSDDAVLPLSSLARKLLSR